MPKIINIIITVTILSSSIFSLFLPSTPVLANNSVVISSKVQYPDDRSQSIADRIKTGRKVPIRESIISVGEDVVSDRFTVFIKNDRVENVLESLEGVKGYAVGEEYGDSTAVSISLDGNIDDVLDSFESSEDVVAVTQVVRRELFAVPTPNDPLFPPTGNFSSSYQWNLNRSASGNYGIDLFRAWEYIDSQGKEWGGDDSIVVAVIDTGMAYESRSKYPYGEGSSWAFSANSDNPTNIFSNSGEVGGNGVDDDGNGKLNDMLLSGGVAYCLDANGNGECDSPQERTKGYIDDVNGMNFPDFYNYWRPLGVDSAPNCTNSPFQAYRCVSQRVCEATNDTGSNHFGCVVDEMGQPNDMMGHGTAVANVISAKVGNSSAGAGIAPNVSIMPISVFHFTYSTGSSSWGHGPLSGSTDLISRAIEYSIEQGVDIINMSFGGTLPDPYEQLAMERAYEEENILLVAASGNRGLNTVDYPSRYESVISVGASAKNGTRVSYSSYGVDLELVAPVGGGIPVQSYSCYFATSSYSNPCLTNNSRPNSPSQFTQFSTGLTAGTSFAAPQVSGVAALVWSMYPEWSNEQVRYVLNMSATPVNNVEYSTTTGYGVLNAYNAVRAVDSDGSRLNRNVGLIFSQKGTDNVAYTKVSSNGSSWAKWSTGDQTTSRVETVGVEGTLGIVQAKVLNGRAYVRHSNNRGVSWSGWIDLSTSVRDVSLLSVGNRVFFTKVAKDGFVYTLRSDNGGVTWGKWMPGSVKGYSSVSMVYDKGRGRLYQAVRGANNALLVRSTTNFGTSWTGWSKMGDTISNDIPLVILNGYMVIGNRHPNGTLQVRYSLNRSNWSSWLRVGSSKDDLVLTSIGNRLVQSHRGNDGLLYTSYSNNYGGSWTGWNKNIAVLGDASFAVDNFSGRIYQAVRGSNNASMYRMSNNNGNTWGSWVRLGSTRGDPIIKSFNYSYW